VQTDSGLMEQTARNFEAANADLQGTLTNLKNKVEALQAAWVGRGAASFQGTMATWSKDQALINRLLAETASLIRTAGRGYASTDDNTANRFTAAGSHDLPL
jgi:WXG100 family type VII secretion target